LDPQAKLQIHKSGQGDICYLRFSGIVDENFDGAAAARGLGGQLIISLGEITRITSFGIRQWMDFIGAAGAACSAIYLVECAPRIVDQLNMVGNFAGRGTVVSFYAPYRCDYCGNERLELIQLEPTKPLSLDDRVCPIDGHAESFDDDPDTYLSYLLAQPPADIDPKVATFLASRTQYALPDGMRKARIEKRIRDRYTFITISGDVGEEFPADKVSEGLEGDVVFDVAAVGRFNADGRSRWRMMLDALAPQCERLLFLGVPASALEGFERERDLAAKGQALTIYLPYACSACAITSQLELTVAEHYAQLRQAAPPAQSCPECGQSISCVASVEALGGIAQLPEPDASLDVPKLLEWSRKPEETPQAASSLTNAPAITGPEVVRQPARGVPLFMLLAVLALAGAGVAIFLALDKKAADKATVVAKARVVEKSHPQPPAWKNRTFTIRSDQLLVTGSSGFSTNKEQGFKDAKAAAIDELCHQVASSIRDPLWIEHVGGQFRQARIRALAELEKALVAGNSEAIAKARQRVFSARQRVAASFFQGAGKLARPERSHFYWEKLRSKGQTFYRVYSLFRLSKVEFKRLVEHYTARKEALSTTAVAFFPGLAWRHLEVTRGAVVVGLKPDSPLRFIGVLSGDILLSAQDRVIKDALSFGRILDQEHSDVAERGGAMLLKIKRGDAAVQEHRLRVPKSTKVVKKGDKRPRKGRRRPGDDTKKLPPANIWDDNPFE
jgi:hypothetical protein